MSGAVTTRATPGRYGTADPTHVEAVPPWGLPEWFIISQTLVPALLYLPGAQAVRLPLRVASFAISLAAFGTWIQRRPYERIPPHPATRWLLFALGYLVLMVLHPTTNTRLAGMAQVALYLAVMAPVFWLPSLIRGPQHVMRLLVILWVANSLNAAVGVLQVYDPARWLPAEFSSLVTEGRYGLTALTYSGLNGQRVVRPPGLFDTPGAVAGPAMYAALLGLVFFSRPGNAVRKIMALGSALIGVAAIYVTQVRTSLLVLVGMLLAYGALLALQRQRMRAVALVGTLALVASAAFSLASSLVGGSVAQRFSTLVADPPARVYYDSRGVQLEYAFRKLAMEYPFGAGLGRWGMMRTYFGNEENPDSPQIWAELQFPAWILDGGLILLGLYCAAILTATALNLRLILRANDGPLRAVSSIVLAANVGTVTLMLGYTPFTTQIGLQFWLLAGALYGASHPATRDRWASTS